MYAGKLSVANVVLMVILLSIFLEFAWTYFKK